MWNKKLLDKLYWAWVLSWAGGADYGTICFKKGFLFRVGLDWLDIVLIIHKAQSMHHARKEAGILRRGWHASNPPWTLGSGNPCRNDGFDDGILNFVEAC